VRMTAVLTILLFLGANGSPVARLRSFRPISHVSRNVLQKPLGIRSGALRKVNVRATENIEAEEEIDQSQVYARALAKDVMNEQGVDLEQLLSPMKAIRLYTEIQEKKKELEETNSAEDRSKIQAEIEEASSKLAVEKANVMRKELKTVFLVQSLLSIVISGMLATDHFPLQPHLPIAAQALGFWTIWLFTVPSLRARKPSGQEKEALNIAFLITPLINILIPNFRRDPGLIWFANVAAVAGCYLYAYLFIDENSEGGPVKIDGIARWLDWGSGRERGASMEMREELARLEKEKQNEN